MNAETLIGLLAERHKDDVFVPECKLGSSWAGAQRLDAWAMPRSWARWSSVGYEVKVTRSDFERDQKWVGYLQVVSSFFFVCPAGLIKGHELPDGCGLMWANPAGTKLVTKVKAKHRDPDPLHLLEMVKYVLMSRSVIVGDMHDANAKRLPPATPEEARAKRMGEYRAALEHAAARKDLAYMINGHAREQVAAAKGKLEAANRVMAEAKEFESRLAELGITWDLASAGDEWGSWTRRGAVRQQIEAIAGPSMVETRQTLRAAKARIDDAMKMLDELAASASAAGPQQPPAAATGDQDGRSEAQG